MPASLEIHTLAKHRLCGMAGALEPDASGHGDPSRINLPAYSEQESGLLRLRKAEKKKLRSNTKLRSHS
jgi:hypothetical protein